MKIVSFGDIHMSTRNIPTLASELTASDWTILSGDLTNYGGKEAARQVISAIRAYCPRLLSLSGNLDQGEVIDFLREQGICLHGEGRRIADLGIFGCGGSNITPFRTPTEFTDQELWEVLQQAYAAIVGSPLILMVCHTPPHNTKVDRVYSGLHVGSPAVRKFIEEKQPDVCITGHIHESAGVDFIGRTKILNAGAFRDGGYIVVTENGGRLTAELKHLEVTRAL